MRVQVRTDLPEQFIGFYDYARRRPGDVFTVPDKPSRILFPKEADMVQYNDFAKQVYEQIKDKDGKVPKEFSFHWMAPVAASTPEAITTSQQALDAKAGRIKEEKAGTAAAAKEAAGAPTGGADVI